MFRKSLASGKRIQELTDVKRECLRYARVSSQNYGLFAGLSEDMKEYGKTVSRESAEKIW